MKINPDTLCIEFESDDFDFSYGRGASLNAMNERLREFQQSFPIYYGRKMDDADQYILGAEEEKGDEIKTRLIGPVPIVRDSAESVLKEIVNRWESGNTLTALEIYNRAKALLERGEE